MHFEESVRMISYPNLTSYIGFLYNLLHNMYFLLSEPPDEGYPKITSNVQKTPEMNVLSPDMLPECLPRRTSHDQKRSILRFFVFFTKNHVTRELTTLPDPLRY